MQLKQMNKPYYLNKQIHKKHKYLDTINRIPDQLFDWGCRIHQLQLCKRSRPPSDEYPKYDTKQSNGEAPVMLELWGIHLNCHHSQFHSGLEW